MAWVWGTLPGYSGPYHLVWSRDLYQVATAQIAAGDRAAAGRALDYLWERQQSADGCLPQNSNLDGSPYWPACSSTRSPTRSCSPRSCGRSDRNWSHVERAAELHHRAGPDLAGAVGERRGRLLAGHDRRRDRRPRVRRRDRRAQRRARRRGALPREGRRVAAQGRGLDAHDQRAALRPAVLPPPHHRRQRERGHDLHDRRRRPDDRPAPRRRHQLPRAGAARGQARRRPASARRCRSSTASSACRRRAASSGTATTTTATARRPTAARSPARATAAGCGRCSRASAASTSCWPASRARRRDGSTRSPPPRARAGCCPSRCGTTSRRRAPLPRHGHGVGDAAGLDARAVHPPRLVARRRAPGRAAARGRLPLRQALSLSATAQVAWPRFSR